MEIQPLVIIPESELKGHRFMQYVAWGIVIVFGLLICGILATAFNAVSWAVIFSMLFALACLLQLRRIVGHQHRRNNVDNVKVRGCAFAQSRNNAGLGSAKGEK